MDTAVKEEVGHYIGGRVVSGSSGRYGDVYNPATGEVARQVALASADEVRDISEALNRQLCLLIDEPKQRAWWKLFKHMDEDGSGRLDADDIIAAQRKREGGGTAPIAPAAVSTDDHVAPST